MIGDVLQFLLHLDEHLLSIVIEYGLLVYVLLFFIVFFETGLVITPFLPGDSLLFATGAIAAVGSLNILVLLILLTLAAILGDALNYSIGRFIGPKLFRKEGGLFFNKEHLVTTQEFYDKHGTKTIIIARFLPIIRTFAPFVAGIGKMSYPRFFSYNIIGGIIWVFLFVIGGYLFGNIPLVKENFSIVILLIVLASFIPIIIGIIRNRRK